MRARYQMERPDGWTKVAVLPAGPQQMRSVICTVKDAHGASPWCERVFAIFTGSGAAKDLAVAP